MADRRALGLIDTSVVIDLEHVEPSGLPERITIAAITLDRLQRVEASFDPIPFDVEAARAFGRVGAAVLAKGRKPPRGIADLQIGATALADQLPLVTRNADDFAGLVEIIAV